MGGHRRTGSTRATARQAAARRRRRGRTRTTGSTCRAGRGRAGSRAPTVRPCRGPRRRRRRRPGAPPARGCRSSPRGRSARRCPRSGGAPFGIHHSRNSPMMWSIADPARVPQHARDQVAERLVARLGELVGPPRRLRPVLAELVELVRRCARGDAEREHVLQRPRVGAVGSTPTARSCMMPSSMPACTAVDCAAVSWSSSCHCSQRWKSTVVGVLGGELGDRRAARVLQLLRPLVPVGAVLLGQRTPGREVVEAAALAARGTPRTPAPGRRIVRRGRRSRSAARLAFHAPSRSIRSERCARALQRRAAPCGCGRGGGRRRTRGSPRPADTSG